jgi:hypothetical protein
MGLDMYLNAKRYLWNFPEDGPDAQTAKAIAEQMGLPNTRIKQIEAEAMYWRKANAIHKWFVDNVQGGTDDCGEYSASREQLQELLDLITEVIDSKDASKLPPTSGFFFGSTDIDDWYWTDLQETKDRLTELLEGDQFKGWDFSYHSSW